MECWALAAGSRSVGVTLLRSRVSKRFGNLVAIDDVSLDHRARRIARHHRSERRRQDDLLQPDQRPVSADRGLDPVRRQGRHGFRPNERVRLGMARTFQITEIFPELTVADNLRVAVELAAG